MSRQHQIVDYEGLAEALATSPKTIAKKWHEYPHFFIGTGRNLKSARFDVDDVVQYLKARDYECLEECARDMDRQVLVSEQAVQKRRLQKEIRGANLGAAKKRRTQESASKDPFNLIS